MIILFKGGQGQGKTTKAEALIKTYKDEAVKHLDFEFEDFEFEGFKYTANRLLHIMEVHADDCESKNITPLFVFDDLHGRLLEKAQVAYKRLELLKPARQIDAILITNEHVETPIL